MTKGCSKLKTFSKLLSSLDNRFKAIIADRTDSNGEGSSLLRLLKLVPNDPADLPTPLLKEFMSHYI